MNTSPTETQAKPNWIERLKKRWGLQSNLDFWLVFIGFAITGSSTAYINRLIYNYLEANTAIGTWGLIGVKILGLLFIYQIVLLIVGAALGQFKFFYRFEKRMWLSIFGRLKNKNSQP